MKRQQIRKLLLTISLLLFPITIYYFSPVLIFNAGLHGIINGSFIVFLLLFILSVPFGRLFCSYICPAGGLQECSFPANDKIPKQRWRNNIKYIIWLFWIIGVILCYAKKGEIVAIDFFFGTVHGISVSSIQSYIIYYGIVLLIFLPSILFGRRVFCHYFCWMAPFMVVGIKLRNFLHLPGLHITIHRDKNCISCGKCNKECPMGIDVKELVKKDYIKNPECIQCGACIDNCPQHILHFEIKARKEKKKWQ